MRGTYTGDLVDGIRQGSGELVFSNGDWYVGEFDRGFRHGKGVFTSERGSRVYDGEWKRSFRHGQGKERWLVSGDRYDGEYAQDAFHGRGVLVRGASGSKYDGEFAHGRRHGYGRMEFGGQPRQSAKRNGATASLRAMISNNTDDADAPESSAVAQGKAGAGAGNVMQKPMLARKASVNSSGNNPAGDGGSGGVHQRVAVYDGHWRDGRMHGEGRYTRADGSFYDGTWLDGLAHGFGRDVSLLSGEVFEGHWKKGLRHGDGAVLRNGKRRKGQWDMGQRVKWTSAEMPIVATKKP